MARGTIIKRKTRTKGVVYDIKYLTADGTQIKRAVGPSGQEAQRRLNEAQALAAVQAGAQRTTSTEMFGVVADRWLAQKKPRIEASTHNDYEIHLRKRLKPAFGDLKLRQITRAKIESYLAGQNANGKLSRRTVNDSLIPLRQILGAAVREGVLATNPAKNDDRDQPLELRYERPTMHFLNREQALAYLDSCEGWYRTLAETVIGAGLRIGEAIALEWRDSRLGRQRPGGLEGCEGQGRGRAPKGDRSRSVLLAPYLLDLLREQRSNQASAGGLEKLVFRSPEGRMLNRTTSGAAAAIPPWRTLACRPRSASTTSGTLPPPSGSGRGSPSTSSNSNLATPTFRRRSTSTDTRTSRRTERLLHGLRPGGEKAFRDSSWYRGWYQNPPPRLAGARETASEAGLRRTGCFSDHPVGNRVRPSEMPSRLRDLSQWPA